MTALPKLKSHSHSPVLTWVSGSCYQIYLETVRVLYEKTLNRVVLRISSFLYKALLPRESGHISHSQSYCSLVWQFGTTKEYLVPSIE
jgi:hypothetical protein